MIHVFSLLVCVSTLAALEVGDSTLVDQPTIGDTPMSIRGGGTLRWRGLVAIYDAGLWIDARRPNAGPLDDVTKRLEFHYRRSISAADLAEATTTTLGRALPVAEREALRPELQRLNALYRDVTDQDVLAFTYVPGLGVQVELGGRTVDTIPGAPFAQALFAIWLGDDPVNERFRKALLGQP